MREILQTECLFLHPFERLKAINVSPEYVLDDVVYFLFGYQLDEISDFLADPDESHFYPCTLYTLTTMSVASSSSLHAFRTSLRPSFRPLSTYSPIIEDPLIFRRPPRPETPTFFTGRPTYHSAISSLSSALSSAKSQLRSSHIYPLPSTLTSPQAPRASWHSAPVLSNLLGTQLRTNSHRRILDLLNELHFLRHIADLSDQPGVVQELSGVLGRYEREQKKSGDGGAEGEKRQEVDEWGRAYGMGRRKESSARVWIIPSKSGRQYLDTETDATSSTMEPEAEILINHSPLSAHFPRITDRETVLRPLRISGLLGAFNVFALARGGGTSGQAGAVGLALARALVVMRAETEEVLQRGEPLAACLYDIHMELTIQMVRS